MSALLQVLTLSSFCVFPLRVFLLYSQKKITESYQFVICIYAANGKRKQRFIESDSGDCGVMALLIAVHKWYHHSTRIAIWDDSKRLPRDYEMLSVINCWTRGQPRPSVTMVVGQRTHNLPLPTGNGYTHIRRHPPHAVIYSSRKISRDV